MHITESKVACYTPAFRTPGIGTGRVALPLSQRGTPVHGIELSPAMAVQLRAKPGADKVG
jgi:hypothetical protein